MNNDTHTKIDPAATGSNSEAMAKSKRHEDHVRSVNKSLAAMPSLVEIVAGGKIKGKKRK